MGPKLPCVNALQLLRALRRDGWEQVRQSGSHISLQHPKKLNTVIVPKHAGIIIKAKTLKSILKQAGLSTDDLRNLL